MANTIFMAGNNKLYRSQDKKIIAEVCAGLAEYLGWEVSMTRLAYVLISIFSAAFPGVIVYLVLWVVMPEK